MCECTLKCGTIASEIKLVLSEELMPMSSIDLSQCDTVFEDGCYDIYFICEQFNKSKINAIDVCVNGSKVGYVDLDDNGRGQNTKRLVKYQECILTNQPFLLHYDLLYLSFVVFFKDGRIKEYFTKFLLCVSKNEEDVINIQNMLHALSTFDDSVVDEWLLGENEKNTANSFLIGNWNKKAYKSLESYIQLVEHVIVCYENNYAYFKAQGKHTIQRLKILASFRDVKFVSRDSFKWIVQNMEELKDVPGHSGISYHGKNYLPCHIQTEVNRRSWDVYENKIIVSFLYTVLIGTKKIYEELNNNVLSEVRIISKINEHFPKGYYAPIITIKKLQIKFYRMHLEKLKNAIETIERIYSRYLGLFKILPELLRIPPRKTNTFCEITAYSQVFEIIIYWFQYGEYNLEKERLLLQVKTLDKLFEYYCLLRLLDLLLSNGYEKVDSERFALTHTYTGADEHYQNETDVANTYFLKNNDITVTLYYQPVISAHQFENGLTLFRTTSPMHGKPDYYTPDFVLKFVSKDNAEEYVIFDAKFSSRINIKRYSLPQVIRKYSCEISSASVCSAPRMVWILQGRVNNNENPVWRYHNSPLSSLYSPVTSYGVISVNTTTEIKQLLWSEIRKRISFM